MANALAKYEEKLTQARERFKRYREKESKVTRVAIDSGIAGLTAFGIGYLETTKPDSMTLFKAADGTGGTHVSLILGGLATVAALMGWAGSESDLVAAIGNGALAAYGFEQGVAKGLAHNQGAKP